MPRIRAIILLALTGGLIFASGILIGTEFQRHGSVAEAQQPIAQAAQLIYPRMVKTIQIRPGAATE